MRFLLIVLFLLYCCSSASWGQDPKLPAWENNVYWYNKHNTGRDFPNVWTHIFTLPDGAIFIKPYHGIAAKIGANYYQDINFKDKNKFSQIRNSFIFQNNLYVSIDNQLFRIDSFNYDRVLPAAHTYIFPPKRIYSTTIVRDNHFYILASNEDEKIGILYKYDGHSLKALRRVYGHFICIKEDNDVQYWLETNEHTQSSIFFSLKDDKITIEKKIPFPIYRMHFNSLELFYFIAQKPPYNQHIFEYKNGKIGVAFPLSHPYTSRTFRTFFTHKEGRLIRFYDLKKDKKSFAQTSAAEKIHDKTYSPETESIYFGSINHLGRLFLLIKQYPRLFNESNSDALFSIGQTANGKIWTGSYNGYITTINGEKQTQSQVQKIMPLPGGISIGNKYIFNDEYSQSLLLFENENQYKKIAENVYGFYNFISQKQIFYAGVNADKGLMYKPLVDIDNPKIPWKFAGKEKGVNIGNCLTISEDRFGNIWTGHSTTGIAVYQPDKDKGKTWHKSKNEIDFGSKAMLTDTQKNLWIATTNGKLYYWNGKHKDDFDTKNFIAIKHPLLDIGEESINFIHQWKDFLILGKYNKILLLDLKAWYQTQQVKIRYLNPIEASLEDILGQNTIFTDLRDETIWFSTNSMLYNWDIHQWLHLPTYKDKSVNQYQNRHAKLCHKKQ